MFSEVSIHELIKAHCFGPVTKQDIMGLWQGGRRAANLMEARERERERERERTQRKRDQGPITNDLTSSH
jgi:hypothetical protein